MFKSDYMICPNCGKKFFEHDAYFCSDCGIRLIRTRSSNNQKVRPQKIIKQHYIDEKKVNTLIKQNEKIIMLLESMSNSHFQ